MLQILLHSNIQTIFIDTVYRRTGSHLIRNKDQLWFPTWLYVVIMGVYGFSLSSLLTLLS